MEFKQDQEIFIYILEPIYTIIKLALLSFKNKNTKLCIFSNNITFREDQNATWFRRWLYGESRYDLKSLNKPIILAVRYILKNQYTKKYEIILKLAIKGLLKLTEIYQQDNTLCIFLHRMIDLIQNLLLNNNISHSNFICDDYIENKYNPKINLNLINDLWSFDDISNITNTLNTMVKDYSINLEIYIEDMLIRKNTLFKKKINDF